MNRVKIHKCYSDAQLPHVWGSSNGLSLRAFARSHDGHPIKIIIPPHVPKLIQTGIILEIPEGHVPFLLSRREDAKKALFVVNAPVPLVQEGEIKFVLYNGGLETQIVQHGDLVANLIILSGTKLTFEVS